MGDHIDYCGGKVLPLAITLGTSFAVSLNNSRQVHIYSTHFSEKKSFSLDNLAYQVKEGWANYPKGVFYEYQQLGLPLPGMNILCDGNLPIGSALSSSASLLVGTAILIQAFTGYKHHSDAVIHGKETALLCHRAETNFNRLQCGIMDQATIALAQEGKVLYMDCETLTCEYLNLNLANYDLLILNSGKPRRLTESKYNQRKAEADEALRRIRKKMAARHLCAIEEAKQDEALSLLKKDAVLYKRATHIMSENRRVEQTRAALLNQDMMAFGQLLNESHQSLRNDYEVTGQELDTLVDESRKFPGVVGARMTGAGFSGCTLTFIHKDAIADYKEFILPVYRKKCGLDARIIKMRSAAGAGEINHETHPPPQI